MGSVMPLTELRGVMFVDSKSSDNNNSNGECDNSNESGEGCYDQ